MQWFSTSIWARKRGIEMQQLETVEDAKEFLEALKPDKRTPLFYETVAKIDEALKGSIAPAEARKAVILFLKDSDALAEVTME